MARLSDIARSIWFRITLVSSLALMATLAVVVSAVYELTLILERTELDEVLVREGDALVDALTTELVVASADQTGAARDLRAIASRTLALNPGSSLHLSVIRSGDVVVSTARGPDRLEALRDSGILPVSPPNQLGSFAGLRSRSVRIDLADQTIQVETIGDDAAIADDARQMAGRSLVAAGIGGLVGLVGLALAAKRSTRGLVGVSSTVRRTRLDDLSVRAPEPEGSNEIAVLARDVNAMLDDLALARASRDELIASVSHELRTPLAAARGHSELLLSGRAVDPDVTIARIDRELRRITRLVDDLLALSRAGDPAWLSRRLTSVRSLIDQLLERLPALGVDALEVGPCPDVVVEVDADRILQALSNLVVNATIHTPEHTRVWLSIENGPGEITFSVSDDGPGLPEEVLARFGEAFVRGSATGSGLGLAVTRAVARAHGGQLTVSSSDRGTKVSLSIPLGM